MLKFSGLGGCFLRLVNNYIDLDLVEAKKGAIDFECLSYQADIFCSLQSNKWAVFTPQSIKFMFFL